MMKNAPAAKTTSYLLRAAYDIGEGKNDRYDEIEEVVSKYHGKVHLAHHDPENKQHVITIAFNGRQGADRAAKVFGLTQITVSIYKSGSGKAEPMARGFQGWCYFGPIKPVSYPPTDPPPISADNPISDEEDFENIQFNNLTTWLWYQTHPGYSRDTIYHTSNVCRSLTRKVMDFLATLPEAEPVKVVPIEIKPVKAKTTKTSRKR
jgi:hypothetical protein